MQLPVEYDSVKPESSGANPSISTAVRNTIHQRMNDDSPALNPGVYVMRNLASDSVVDLSGGDSKSIIGFPRHGLENQQWEFGILGDGWYIRSAHTGNYLNIEKGLGDGFPVVANSYPVSWVVENDAGEGEDVFRILWPNTPYSFDLEFGSPTPGTKVSLWSRTEGARHQLWQLQRCPDKEEKIAEVATLTETETPESTTTTTTTTTVTTTTVVNKREGRAPTVD